jgi:hypothetical protein
MAHGDDLGHDRHRDLGGRARADVQADRAVQARDLGRRKIEGGEPLAPLGRAGPRAERADIERR